jgi:hypothetical protein
MKDPRENKLPQWAQQLLYDERLKVALRFPEDPDPVPNYVANQNSGFWMDQRPKNGTKLFYVSGQHIRIAFVFAGSIYDSDDANGWGRRPAGPFFVHEGDARLALRWKKARRAAADLLQAETATAIRD